MLRLRTLGGLSIANASPIEGASARRRPLALLALLAAAGGRGLSRDKIIAMLWPESDAEHGRNSLSRVLSSLRSELGAEDIVLGTLDLRLNPDVITSDLETFEQHLEAGELERAVALYDGDFLDGVFLKSAPDFERWADEQRARLKVRQSDALELLALQASHRGDNALAVSWWRRLAALEPVSARSARGLMAALATWGDRAAALQHFQVHSALCHQDLGLDPEPDVSALADQLRGTSAALADGAPNDESQARVRRSVEMPITRGPASRPLGFTSADPVDSLSRSLWQSGLTRAAVFAAVGLIVAVTLSALRSRTVSNVDQRRVAVSVFANRTGDSTLDALGVAVADWITGGLHAVPGVDVVDGTTSILTYNALNADAAAPGLGEESSFAEATGAGVLITGYIIRDAGSLVFVSRVVDASEGRVIGIPPPISAPAQRPYSALDPLRQRVLGILAVHFDERLETVLTTGTSSPPTLAAYKEFVDGLTTFLQADYARSVRQFQRAYELDSTFLTPLLWASWAAGNSGRSAERRVYTDELARRRQHLSALEKHGFDYTLAMSARDFPRALAAVREASNLAPGSVWTYNLGYVLRQMNRFEEAAAAFGQINLQRGWVRHWAQYWLWYTAVLHLAGDHERELRVAKAGRIALPNNRTMAYLEALALAAQRRIQELDRVLGEVRGFPDPRHEFGWEVSDIGMELHERGDDVNARRLFDESVAWFQSLKPEIAADPNVRRDFAQVLYDAERWADARSAVEVLAKQPGYERDVLMYRGLLAARANDKAHAGEIIKVLTAEQDSARYLGNLLRASRIAAVLGDREHAVRLLREYYDRTGQPIPFHINHRDWEGLRRYAPYIALTRERR